jgi:hypothetical protein
VRDFRDFEPLGRGDLFGADWRNLAQIVFRGGLFGAVMRGFWRVLAGLRKKAIGIREERGITLRDFGIKQAELSPKDVRSGHGASGHQQS